jgi:phytoene dehydrogenase-like protein
MLADAPSYADPSRARHGCWRLRCTYRCCILRVAYEAQQQTFADKAAAEQQVDQERTVDRFKKAQSVAAATTKDSGGSGGAGASGAAATSTALVAVTDPEVSCLLACVPEAQLMRVQ